MEITTIDIKDEEVLRYLGYRGQELTKEMINIVSECKEIVKKSIIPRYIYERTSISIEDNYVFIGKSNLVLKGKSIVTHLKQCEECLLMAVTLGNDVEKLIKLYERKDLTKALIIDACATVAIEEVCENIEKSVEESMAKIGKNITFRFSPGYGDLSINIQKYFLNLLDAERKIGLTCSEHNILIPRKSVTAIIGISSKPMAKNLKSCYGCSVYKQCNFRREGNKCGSNII